MKTVIQFNATVCESPSNKADEKKTHSLTGTIEFEGTANECLSYCHGFSKAEGIILDNWKKKNPLSRFIWVNSFEMKSIQTVASE